MVPGIFAKTFAGTDPRAVLGAARGAGFSAVQWNWACAGLGALPEAIPEAAVAALRAASRETGVALAAVSATANLAHPDPARRGRAALAAIIGAAGALTIPVVTLCSGTRDPDDPWRAHPGNADPSAWADLRAELDHALPLAAAAGVRLGIEPEPGNLVTGPTAALRLLREVGHPALGIVLDPANLFESAAEFDGGRPVREALDALGPRVVLAHAKDRDGAGRVVPAGTGLVDWPAFAAGLRAAGYDGPLVAHGLEAADAPAVAARLEALG